MGQPISFTIKLLGTYMLPSGKELMLLVTTYSRSIWVGYIETPARRGRTDRHTFRRLSETEFHMVDKMVEAMHEEICNTYSITKDLFHAA